MEPSDEVKPNHPDSATTRAPGQSLKLNPNWVLTLLGVMLLAALVAITLRGRSLRAPDEDEIRALKAEIGAAEAEINARRATMGLRPMEGTAEPVDQVAKRMQRDAETMVALANTFRNSLMEKEAVLSSKNEEILDGEQIRKSLGIEVERLRHELAKALAGNSQAESLQREVDSLRNQRDTLSDEVQRLRSELESRSNVSDADLETLKRQLDEAVRAKEFFEAKAKQFEQRAEQ